ncbi:MAG: M1 family metallopeptidase [Deltaproteobacteria bacterium]|nr:M1 family metallopeptidase [Deltaproteobacteria bacterium]
MIRVAAIALGLAACKENRPPPKTDPPVGPGSGSALPTTPVRRDPHSQSRPDQVSVQHLDLALLVNFETKVLTGNAQLRLERRDPTATEVVFDTNGLTIDHVKRCGSDEKLPFTLGPVVKRLGRALTVTTQEPCVAIEYRTSPDATALLWVEPSGTAGKVKPMLFTQSQAIHARTWIPLQDSPGVRFTYTAHVEVPDGLRAVMSAENPEAVEADKRWHFKMDQKIPSYLMALAVGDLTFKPIGKRTGVYAEPSVVTAAVNEFAEVDTMMEVGEKLYGPYRWGRYDILVLPPSFPFGGMENPRLTFLTPTVITGDRGLVSLIAHELAHSWSGNLVTNSTWNDLWLNEGFTTYVERRIMEELRGKEAADMSWAMGRKDLEKVLADAGGTNKDTRLALDFGPDRDPEDAPTDVAYEKGALLLRAMELAFGRPTFDAFLRARFDRLAFQSTDSRSFEADAASLFAAHDPGWTLADWLHKPGLPPTAPPSTSTRVAALEAQAVTYAKEGKLPDTKTWKTTDWMAFLDGLPGDISRPRLLALDAKHQLTRSPNRLIQMRWFPVLIKADIREAAPQIEEFLMHVGRRWLVRAVYEPLIARNDFWRDLAATTFEKAKAGYHPLTRDAIAAMLAPPKP